MLHRKQSKHFLNKKIQNNLTKWMNELNGIILHHSTDSAQFNAISQVY